MPQQGHRVWNVDPAKMLGSCSVCGPNVSVEVRERKPSGLITYRCSNARPRHIRSGKEYRLHKGDSCERCGFVAAHPAQLDVHHVDGNRRNNAPANLQTLCANCHRLVHQGWT